MTDPVASAKRIISEKAAANAAVVSKAKELATRSGDR